MVFDRRIRSLGFAVAGVRTLVTTQPNARIHAGATIAVVVSGLVCGLDRMEWCALVVAVAAVWVAEAMNTSIELLADVVSPEVHPIIGRAKDVAAGAVLLAALGSVAIGVVVFGPYCLHALGVEL